MKEQTIQKTYSYEGEEYLATIVFKYMRSKLRMTLHAEKKALSVSACPYVPLSEIDEFVIKGLPSLVKRAHKRRKPLEEASEEGVIYILGKKVALPEGMDEKSYLQAHRKEAKAYFAERTRLYEKVMEIKTPYKIGVGLMRTRFGSNSSKTHTIHYSLYLYRFEEAIIDSVVIHELVHDRHRNHGYYFYKRLYRFCPDYDILRRKLIHNVFGDDAIKKEGEEEHDD